MDPTETNAPKVEALFHAALDLPPEQRDAFLTAECGDEPRVLQDVRSLLSAHDEAGGFLDDPAAPPQWDAPEGPAGRCFGKYRLRERIGRGGMSDVYLAERTDGDFDQVVAVKVIRRGLSDADVLRRFRTECRVLAMLEHPNIARMIDGGLDEDGTPYLVMEYVDGQPITTYCEGAALSVEERLRLFITVCEAVHHAHKHSTIHRDLKPSNVLVDSTGNVKLLDFGIARILSLPEGVEDQTSTGLRVMTPAYASPEQIRGERLSTATDVYSLGALLYNLLTGRKPLELENLPLPELARIATQVAPVEPSVALRRDSTTTREDHRLSRRLEGDIDTIVMMALRKEPDRRYASAEQLADDVRKHLDRRPVLAQPNTLGYRIKTFTRRNATGVSLGLLVFVLLVAAAIGGPMLYMRAERARHEALMAQKRAEQNAATAERTTRLIVDLFRSSDPKTARGETVTAREVLRRGARRLDEDLKDEPVILARLLHTVGDVYFGLGLADDARTMLTRSIDLQKEYGNAPLTLADSLERLAIVMERQGDLPVALKTARRSLSLRELHAGVGAEKTAMTRATIGHILQELGRFEESRAELERAQKDLETLGVDELTLVPVLHELSTTLDKLDAGAESLRLARRALAIREAKLDSTHPDVADSLNSLALRLVSMGHREEAIPLRRRSLMIAEKTYGRDHPELIDLLFSIGFDEFLAGRFVDAGELFERGRALVESSFGAEHRRYGRFLIMLARVDVELGRVDSAVERSRRALANHQAALGRDHVQIGPTSVIHGAVLLGVGRPEQARPVLERGLELVGKGYGTDHWRYGSALGWVAILHRQLGNRSLALEHYERIDRIFEAALPKDHPRRAANLIQWAITLAQEGDTASAKAHFARGTKLHGERGASHPDRLRARIHFALALGETVRAEALVRRFVAAGHATGQLRNNRDYRPARAFLPALK